MAEIGPVSPDTLSFTCAICCGSIAETDSSLLKIRVSRPSTPAKQEMFAHRDCLAQVIGACVPLGEVFETDDLV
jgi:hypothetical protein